MSSLRDRLKPVPQNPLHHPEGDVFSHEQMVRKALPIALSILKRRQLEPDSPFADLDLNLTSDEVNLLRASAWTHDIGKATATTYDPKKGYQAIGHESPQHFIPNMRMLGSTWHQVWDSADFSAKKDLFFIINHHMALRDDGFGSRLNDRLIGPNGQYLNERRVKLLLILIMMDWIGRGFPNPEQYGEEAADAMIAGAAKVARLRARRAMHVGHGPAPDDPVDFIVKLQGKPLAVIQRAFQGKFGRQPSADELSPGGY